MGNKIASWHSVVVGILGGTLIGCSDGGGRAAGENAATATGAVQIALSTTSGIASYRLRNAVFQIVGPEVRTVSSEASPDDEFVSAMLVAGSYQITLSDGWRLERSTPSGIESVSATLLSEPTRPVVIAGGTSTTLRYQFRTGGGSVELGHGVLNVGIQVIEDAGTCDTAVGCSTCPSTSITCGDTCATTCAGHLRVRALIDGRSQLVVQRDRVWWSHFDFVAPGLHEGAQEPTELWIQTGASPEAHVLWCPAWPTGCNTCDGDCGQLQTQISSELLVNLTPALPSAGQLVTANLEITEGRGRTFIAQRPDASNDYTLILEFDDDAPLGSTHYEVGLTFSFAP